MKENVGLVKQLPCAILIPQDSLSDDPLIKMTKVLILILIFPVTPPADRDYVDISIAVATPKGLVVPVLRNADQLSFAGVEKVSA